MLFNDIMGIVKSRTTCWRCRKVTPVAAVGGLVWADAEESDADIDWVQYDLDAPDLVLLNNVSDLPSHVVDVMKYLRFNFNKRYSRSAEMEYWANCCVHCDSLQGDHFLHNQPGAAFFPQYEDQAAMMELYLFQLQKVTHIDCGFSLGSAGSLIASHAKQVLLDGRTLGLNPSKCRGSA
jgi:hypothetical protein